MVYTLQWYSSAYKYYLYLVLCLAYVVAVPGALPLPGALPCALSADALLDALRVVFLQVGQGARLDGLDCFLSPLRSERSLNRTGSPLASKRALDGHKPREWGTFS